jgi:hypothetical protein
MRRPGVRHYRGAPVGRPYKGALCLLCATRARLVSDESGWCAVCRAGYDEARSPGEATVWLNRRKNEFHEARRHRDRLVKLGPLGLKAIAEMAQKTG